MILEIRTSDEPRMNAKVPFIDPATPALVFIVLRLWDRYQDWDVGEISHPEFYHCRRLQETMLSR